MDNLSVKGRPSTMGASLVCQPAATSARNESLREITKRDHKGVVTSSALLWGDVVANWVSRRHFQELGG